MEWLVGALLYILIGLGIEELAQRVERRYHFWRTGRYDYERPGHDLSIVFAWPLFLMVIITARRRDE